MENSKNSDEALIWSFYGINMEISRKSLLYRYIVSNFSHNSIITSCSIIHPKIHAMAA
jgi:hypothetical protein